MLLILTAWVMGAAYQTGDLSSRAERVEMSTTRVDRAGSKSRYSSCYASYEQIFQMIEALSGAFCIPLEELPPAKK